MALPADAKPSGVPSRYIAGTYPESPAHILAGDTLEVLCGSRISPYKHMLETPPRRVCAKCAKKAQSGK